MPKPADTSTKKLISLAPDTWVQWVTNIPNIIDAIDFILAFSEVPLSEYYFCVRISLQRSRSSLALGLFSR